MGLAFDASAVPVNNQRAIENDRLYDAVMEKSGLLTIGVTVISLLFNLIIIFN
uniref:Neur_chan_memb domain-containing protein n=1 Tax=Heterorhabditis bacteriophora TaxID=37862 RepID=A0A1I7WT00_HETBA